ncbi:MAG: GNAT family N-acetyltransferase [Nitrososphaerales archaeon]|nr:GNAT family N-acetyltransferase [Nitrososphaerales archaeon]
MKPGEVYEQFRLSDGRHVTLRALRSSDLRAAVRFANDLVRERSSNPDLGVLIDTRVTLKEERKWLARRVAGIRKNEVFSVAAAYGERVVGNCEVTRPSFKDEHHTGSLGIAIVHGFRGAGLGRRMMEVLLETAAARGVRLVELRVFSINTRAHKLYAGLGFRTAGRIPGKVLRDGRQIDEILMYRKS